ncbi:hypothetical protein J7I93_15020 [Bacillus sp. ISL-47]|uniref:hypothetical protein n=1 Tax=Bacillus sp. ISL-47 TaxID=2819130 RepID=UPI001BEA861E|nr:hypothetical protein [Bacillus sp. ISL-47]MBT2689502.1 hypothetical protein [Bacillus sp. ISL-47]MBT2708320.1 hypothetical protein [Pseudomonas sp. ISL-84]
MSFSVNQEGSPKLFLGQSDKASNQNTYRLNYLQEVIKEQQSINNRLAESYGDMQTQLEESFTDMNKLVKKAAGRHNHHFENLVSKLEKQDDFITRFLEVMNHRDKEHELLLERLTSLEEMNKAVLEALEKESPVHQKILEQVSCQDAATQALSRKFDKFEAFSEEASAKFKTQEEIKEEISKKLDVQEMFHSTVMERLDQQEAITQKITRQLDNLKSIVYERASHLSERFEKSFKQLAKPVHSFFISQEEKEKKNNVSK